MCKVGIKSRVSNIESDNSQNVGLEHGLRTANEQIGKGENKNTF